MMTYNRSINSPKDLSCRALSELKQGEEAYIQDIHAEDHVAKRFRELGIIEGACVKILHEAPFGGDPVAIQVRGGKLAIRRAEAKFISTQRVPVL